MDQYLLLMSSKQAYRWKLETNLLKTFLEG